MRKVPNTLSELVRHVVEPMGYELVGVEYLTGMPGGNLLRVYIDKADGILLDDCARVSHQLSGVLDVEDPIPDSYQLEISSPGLDRPLFKPEDFQRFRGQVVQIKLDSSVVGRRRYKGILHGLEKGCVLVEIDGETHALELEQIRSARLVPQI